MKGMLALAALLLVLAPGASAHFEDFNFNAATMRVGPYQVAFEPRPGTVFAGAGTSLVAQVIMPSGLAMRSGEGEVSVAVEGPGGFATTKTLGHDGSGWFITTVIFPARGTYTTTLTVRDAEGAHTNATSVDVYPDLPVRIRPIDAQLDVYANRTTRFDLEVVDATYLNRTDAVQDLEARIEHWASDHARMLEERSVQAERFGTGAWRAQTSLPSSGMYHIRFASSSGGFNYDETPPLHIYAMDPLPDEAPADGAATPSGGLLAALVAVGLALASMRGRRGPR